MTQTILRVRGVTWRAGARDILNGVGLDAAAGEFIAIIGRNGAGKSTLLDIIGGLRSPVSGEVRLRDRPLTEWSATDRARTIAHLPQSLRADLTMAAESLVLMGRYAHASQWFESAADREIAATSMRRCDCLEYRHRPLGTLSGGERQRVYLAACLAQQPELLLLDEPTTFLDIDQQLQCFALLREEARQGMACLAVTHDINLALTFCTRLVLLADGHVVLNVPAAEALDDTTWLRVFSDRLQVERSSATGAWVRYQ